MYSYYHFQIIIPPPLDGLRNLSFETHDPTISNYPLLKAGIYNSFNHCSTCVYLGLWDLLQFSSIILEDLMST